MKTAHHILWRILAVCLIWGAAAADAQVYDSPVVDTNVTNANSPAVGSGAVSQSSPAVAQEPRIVVRLPRVIRRDSYGVELAPDVAIAPQPGRPVVGPPVSQGAANLYLNQPHPHTAPIPNESPSTAINRLVAQSTNGPETLPLPDPTLQSGDTAGGFAVEPVFEEFIQQPQQKRRRRPFADWYGWNSFRRHPGYVDGGIGQERVMHAPFHLDTTQPLNQYRFGLELSKGLEFPDRAEYFWASPPRGPNLPENEVDFQVLRAMFELGGESFSTRVTFPFRVLDPDANPNHAGFGDLTVATKLVLLDGNSWQISQLTRIVTPTGAASAGLGTGHLSMEPGVLFRYKWSELLYIHAQIQYWFALGGNPITSGEVLNFGLGLSHVAYENAVMSVVPVHEIMVYSIHGGKTAGPNDLIPGATVSADGEVVVNMHSGTRVNWDLGGDLGIVELGITGGVSVSNRHFFRDQLKVELGFIY